MDGTWAGRLLSNGAKLRGKTVGRDSLKSNGRIAHIGVASTRTGVRARPVIPCAADYVCLMLGPAIFLLVLTGYATGSEEIVSAYVSLNRDNPGARA